MEGDHVIVVHNGTSWEQFGKLSGGVRHRCDRTTIAKKNTRISIGGAVGAKSYQSGIVNGRLFLGELSK